MTKNVNHWLAASLLSVSSMFGQSDCCKSNPCPPEQIGLVNPGYSLPARCCVEDAYDIFCSASFTYWSPSQENMELGIVSRPSTIYSVDGNLVNLEADYCPGFQVGIGMNSNHDSWDAYARYTWFRSRQTTETTLNPDGEDQLSPFWQVPVTQGNSNPTYYRGREVWKFHMDLLDLELSRPYYSGTHLTINPFFGVRAAWIRQRIAVDYLDEASDASPQNVFVRHWFHSWAVGPRTGFNSNWLVGKGFRLIGIAAGDILFTQYRGIAIDQVGRNVAGDLVNNTGFHTSQKRVNHPRAHAEIEIGLGWETACSVRGWHLDLSAGYNYQVFFGQNMFRNFLSNFSLNSLVPSGELYLHGLTAKVQLDF